jgi:hypothetical protein
MEEGISAINKSFRTMPRYDYRQAPVEISGFMNIEGNGEKDNVELEDAKQIAGKRYSQTSTRQ